MTGPNVVTGPNVMTGGASDDEIAAVMAVLAALRAATAAPPASGFTGPVAPAGSRELWAASLGPGVTASIEWRTSTWV